MNKGDKKVFKFVETLGSLRICTVPATEYSNIKDGARIVMGDINYEYGTHSFYDVELITGSTTKDVEMGNYTFSYLIPIRATYYRTYNSYALYFSLSFLKSGEEVIELKDLKGHGSIDDGSILYDVKLFMSLLSIIGYSEDFVDMWRSLFNDNDTKAKEYLYKYVEGIRQTIAKFPFIKSQIKKNMMAAAKNCPEMQDEITKCALF